MGSLGGHAESVRWHRDDGLGLIISRALRDTRPTRMPRVGVTWRSSWPRRTPRGVFSRRCWVDVTSRAEGFFVRECKAKAARIKLIESDFLQQTKRLIQLSTPELFEHASTSLPTVQPTPRFWQVYWAVHNRYGTTIASQLLSSGARWDPPELMGDIVSQLVWFQTPVTQLRAWLARLDPEMIKWCCNLYLVPSSVPKSKSERYDILIHQFRACSFYLLSLLNIDFAREYLALLPLLPNRNVKLWKLS